MTRIKALHCLGSLLGLPLMAMGVVVLIIHFALHSTSNTLLIIALLLEVVGVAVHYWRIKHQK